MKLIIKGADFFENSISVKEAVIVPASLYQSGSLLRRNTGSTSTDVQNGDDISEAISTTQYTTQLDIYKVLVDYPTDMYQIELAMSYGDNTNTMTYLVAVVCDSNDKVLGVIPSVNNQPNTYLRQTYKINMSNYSSPASIYFCNGLKSLNTKGDAPVVTAFVEQS